MRVPIPTKVVSLFAMLSAVSESCGSLYFGGLYFELCFDGLCFGGKRVGLSCGHSQRLSALPKLEGWLEGRLEG